MAVLGPSFLLYSYTFYKTEISFGINSDNNFWKLIIINN